MNRFLLIFSIIFFLAGTAGADTPLSVQDIRYGQHGPKTRVVIELNKPTAYRAFNLDGPPRVVVDIPGAAWATFPSRHLKNPLIRAYRSGAMEKEKLTRIVFDLKKTAVINKIFILPATKNVKDRIVLDLEPVSQNIFTARLTQVYGERNLQSYTAGTKPVSQIAATRQESLAQIPLPGKKPAASPYRRKYVIVIDAGHGGGDPGAMSGRIREKNITLSVAKKLQRKLEETGRYRVVMTRQHDVYIRLRDRVKIARKAGGDLFISIHADKIGRKNVRGASIYTLSEKASDAETARLAESENNAGIVAGVDLAGESADIANILLDLAMREKMNESNMLAKMIEKTLRQKKIHMLKNSHRSAGFAVLKAPDIPAVLVETGFLSNPTEAKLLSSSAFQNRIAAAIVEGIDAYFRKMRSLQKIE